MLQCLQNWEKEALNGVGQHINNSHVQAGITTYFATSSLLISCRIRKIKDTCTF